MGMARVIVSLSPDECSALFRIAEIECRDPKEQMRYMLREEAQRRKLIPGNDLKNEGRLGSDSRRETATTKTSLTPGF